MNGLINGYTVNGVTLKARLFAIALATATVVSCTATRIVQASSYAVATAPVALVQTQGESSHSGPINGFAINGAGTTRPAWVKRATAHGRANASAVLTPTRMRPGRAAGVATAVVSLSPTHTEQARAEAVALAVAHVDPALRYAASAMATATASGYGAVRRDVFATAGGDAISFGEALTAQAIGEAQNTAIASVECADPHLIFPGRALARAEGSSSASGDVTRYATGQDGIALAVQGWGEASIQKNGDAYFRHEGHARGATLSTANVGQDKTRIIVSLGSFDFGNSEGTAACAIRYSAKAIGESAATSVPVSAMQIFMPTCTAGVITIASAQGVLVRMATARAECGAPYAAAKAWMRHLAAAGNNATAFAASTRGGRVVYAESKDARAQAIQSTELTWGRQHWGGVATAIGMAGGDLAMPCMDYAGRAVGTLAVAVRLALAAQVTRAGRVHDAMATALSGRAYAVANSEIRAPDNRRMIVPRIERGMLIPAEQRRMLVI